MPADKPRTGFALRKKRLLIVATLLGLAGLIWFFTLNRESLYKGRPISYWVDQACRGYGRAEAYQARLEVKNIGPAAVPYLVKRLRTSDGWRGKWFWIRAHLPEWLQGDLSNSILPGEMRVGAALTLQILGPDAKTAVPALIRLLPHADVPAVEALTCIGPSAKAALPALHSLLLTTTNMSRRVGIAGALWYIGGETNFVLQVCTDSFVPNSGDDGINAGSYLARLGPAAAPAVPFALAVLQNTNRHEGARGNAANILAMAHVSSPEILAALVDGIKSENPQIVRICCAQALWRFDRQYAPLATQLTLQLIASQNKSSPGNPQNFAVIFGGGDLDPGDSIPTLKELLHDDSEDLRKAAALALETIHAQSKLDVKQ
jgi:HEAT repeat protein